MWWKEAVVYQAYPASFKDSNGDGLGYIKGVISKLDYMKDLGIHVLWLSPMYKSPQVDMGYDISDFEDVYPPFGTLADMHELIQGLHERGMRLILDLVVNHTSNQHAWFQESRFPKTTRNDTGTSGALPAMMPRVTGNHRTTGEPALAGACGSGMRRRRSTTSAILPLSNPILSGTTRRRAGPYTTLQFVSGLRSVDRFRVDTVNKYSKPKEFIDVPVTDSSSPWQYAYPSFCNGPKIRVFLKEMVREATDPYGEIMTVGELPSTPDPNEILRYVSASERELDMVFHFDMVYLGMGKWQRFIHGTDIWTTIFAENHDLPRSISRFASDAPEHREASAKLLALMLTTLTGTLFIYQGQEIGTVNMPRDWPVEEYKDLETHNFYAGMKRATSGDPEGMEAAMDGIAQLARDHARVPMQWDSFENAGFSASKGKPWMRVHENYRHVNVDKQLKEEASPLHFWKRLLRFRKQHRELFIHGVFMEYDHENKFTFTYTKAPFEVPGRSVNGHAGASQKQAVVFLNFSSVQQQISFPDSLERTTVELAISTKEQAVGGVLEPYEGRV